MNKIAYPKTLKEFTDILMITKKDLKKKKKMDPKGHMYGYMTDEYIETNIKEFKYLMENDGLDDFKIYYRNGIPDLTGLTELHTRWVMAVPIEWLGG